MDPSDNQVAPLLISMGLKDVQGLPLAETYKMSDNFDIILPCPQIRTPNFFNLNPIDDSCKICLHVEYGCFQQCLFHVR